MANECGELQPETVGDSHPLDECEEHTHRGAGADVPASGASAAVMVGEWRSGIADLADHESIPAFEDILLEESGLLYVEAAATIELLDLRTDRPALVRISLDDGYPIQGGAECS